MSQQRFPRYLSSPFQVLWFETDELGIIFFFLLLALVFGGWWSWVLLFAGPYVYTKVKKKYPRGFLRHTMYFLGLVNLPGYPSAFAKTFRE